MKKKAVIAGVILGIAAIAAVWFSIPAPIIKSADDAEIDLVMVVNSEFDNEDVTDQVDGDQLLQIIEGYTRSRFPHALGSYQMTVGEIKIILVEDNQSRTITLGDINVVYESVQKGAYTIHDSEQLAQDIREILPSSDTPEVEDDGAAAVEDNYSTLCSLQFLDEDTGWIIHNYAKLLTTGDGGAHWTEVGTADRELDLVRFISAEEGWAISGTQSETGSDTDTYSGLVRYSILHTTDGGADWTVQYQAEEQAATTKLDLLFLNDAEGFAQIGSLLFATHNGGEEWLPVSFGTEGFTLLNMCFIDPETGWAVGTGPADCVASVLHTVDGGLSWELQFSTHEMATDVILSIGIGFFDDQAGWFTVIDTNKRIGELYRTEDGGLSWALINDSIGSIRPYPREIDFITDQVGWIPVDCGAGPIDGGLSSTGDGGKSFTYTEASDIRIDGAENILGFTEIDFITEQVGWAVVQVPGGSLNSLVKTEDGGDTWTQVYP